MATALGWGFAVLAGAGCLYTVMSAVFVLRFFQNRATPKPEPAMGSLGDVTILKPLHRDEAGLRHNLESFFAEAERVDAQLVFGLQDPADPARPVVEALMAAHGGVNARLCIDPTPHGPNRKVANLINMAALATGAVLVVSDSDIAAPKDYLPRVLAALAQAGVGVVTCPYAGRGEIGGWSKIAAMGLSYGFLPNVIAGVSLGLAKPCMGSTIALRRETLEKIGGFQAFANLLADDYAMGAAVRGLGLRSVTAPILVAHSCTEATLSEVFAHELRWARTIKGVDLAGHIGSVTTHPLPLALLAAAFLAGAPVALGLVALAFVVRLALKASIDRAWGASSGPWRLTPLRDMLSFAVFLASFFGRAVVWRGETFHVSTDGDLSVG